MILRPISVFFSLPQQNLPELTRGMADGVLPVDALNADGKGALDKFGHERFQGIGINGKNSELHAAMGLCLLPRVPAIVEAWYPGQAGGQAIAEILTGAVNPSGRLPITFPVDLAQTPRPELPGLGSPWGTPTTIDYHEGAEVGYRWYAQRGEEPLYAFGHGLSYTSFE